MPKLIDLAAIEVSSGAGGDGAISFRREKFVPRGGPSGGDGGRGGSVYLEVSASLVNLRDFQQQRIFRAKNGEKGGNRDMYGANGEDLDIKVPPGTLVFDPVDGRLVADLVEPGSRVMVAEGGKGGRGNAKFATSTNQTPRVAEKGQPGVHRALKLELKLLADVGLIGFPNAGKSTLLAGLTQARPRIGDYPFTTLSPNLGIMALDDYTACTIADMPGLIEGAHQGRGLGIQFLRHIQRTRILVFVIDASRPDPWGDYLVLRSELKAFDPALSRKARLAVFNKMDLAPAMPGTRKSVQALFISALTGQGLEPLRTAIARALKKAP